MTERPTLPDLPTFCRGPFTVNPHTMWIMGVDEFGGPCHIADMRGWGYLTGQGQALALSSADAIAAQRKTAEFIVKAMNMASAAAKALQWEKDNPTVHVFNTMGVFREVLTT